MCVQKQLVHMSMGSCSTKRSCSLLKRVASCPKDGTVRWGLELQCKLVGDAYGPEGWVSFANRPNEVCGAGVVQHLGGLHASELAVTAQPVMDTSGVTLV